MRISDWSSDVCSSDLRAVAVIAVILFHCAPYGPVRGGFLGVDLFFVLSGFLITGVLHDEYRRYGRIDLKTFYARRMARLAPALLRSEEHTSELQSLMRISYAVFCLKKKKKNTY